ncbi:MAG: T9SS type A sorting domain-containing protein, partial [Bacteroidia bacterium]|nr:T9SS type A sorting domain-containing protein [Bacteroidia bacterium]
TNGNFRINFDQEKPLKIQIFDESGKLVYSKHAEQLENLTGINLTNFNTGIYACVINTDKGCFTKKFAVIK